MNSPLTGRRARNLEEWLTVMADEKFISEPGLQAALSFRPRPSDVLISPFAKSGTTWLQQIVHGLRTRGSMAFDEITEVAPWIEIAHDFGWDLEANQVAEPRIFKSHLPWDKIPKGGRYICSFRHPYDVAVSYYRFFEGWLFEVGSISLEEFCSAFIMRDPENEGYWFHLGSWWEQRDNNRVLLLCFEQMRLDLPATVREVAQFVELELDDELLDIVVRQSSKEFMLAHRSHFDEHLVQEYYARKGGVPVDRGTSKITRGTPDDERYKLSSELKGRLDSLWHQMIFVRFGFEDYSAFRQAVAEAQSF